MDAFSEFQLEEYKNISNSHYESVKQVSVFFRYYLLILAAPVLIINLVFEDSGGLHGFLDGNGPASLFNLVVFYFTSVSLVGFFIFLYVVNVRHDAILYARSVNKVRKYFYEKSDLKIELFERFLSLPTVSTRPKYAQTYFFLPLIFVFSWINCGLLFSGLYLKLLNKPFFGKWVFPFNSFIHSDWPLTSFSVFFLTALFFVAHIIGYIALARLRNNSYLRSYRIGIDIDGVVNEQTTHFIEWLEILTGKKINKRRIKEIPVSLNTGLGVTDFDEKIVFNTREYWTSLPFRENAVRRIEGFQKAFGYRIHFYSYRAWPQYDFDGEIKKAILGKGFTPLEDGEIRLITENWLEENGLNVSVLRQGLLNGIVFNIKSFFSTKKDVVIEYGNPYLSDTRFTNAFRKSILNQNRFQNASTKGFKFFIEDFPENAIKLSSMCDYVFMFDEPYNSKFITRLDFPKNVIRVFSWDDIYRYMKLLS